MRVTSIRRLARRTLERDLGGCFTALRKKNGSPGRKTPAAEIASGSDALLLKRLNNKIEHAVD